MRLTISFAGVQISYFLDPRIKNYGCLKILGEVWAGRACARAKNEELTTCAKIWKQEIGRKGQGEYKKRGPTQERVATSSRQRLTRPAVADHWSSWTRRPLVGPRSLGWRPPVVWHHGNQRSQPAIAH
jgi:hypothetical protein